MYLKFSIWMIILRIPESGFEAKRMRFDKTDIDFNN